MIRPTISVAPPGANGTTMRMGLVGYGCACPMPATRNNAVKRNSLIDVLLTIHRALKDQLAKVHAAPEDLTVLGEHCSMTERRADDATRDAISWLKCEYMLDKVGDVFSGIVSAVTAFGLFVQLDESFVEGLIHVTALPEDYYHFDPVRHRMVGRRTHQEYCLGQRLEVAVARVSLDDRKIDFTLAVTKPSPARRRR